MKFFTHVESSFILGLFIILCTYQFATAQQNEVNKDKLVGKWEVVKMDLDGLKEEKSWEPVDENHYNVYHLMPNNEFVFIQSRVDTLRGTYKVKKGKYVICDFETNVQTKTKVQDLTEEKAVFHLNYKPNKNQYDGKQYSLYVEKKQNKK